MRYHHCAISRTSYFFLGVRPGRRGKVINIKSMKLLTEGLDAIQAQYSTLVISPYIGLHCTRVQAREIKLYKTDKNPKVLCLVECQVLQ